MPDRYVASESAARKLGEIVRAYDSGELFRRPASWRTRRNDWGQRTDHEFGKASALIAGSTGPTPNSGTVTFYTFTSSGGTSATTASVTAYNMTDRDVTTAGWVQCQRHHRTGNWMIVHGANAALFYYGLLQGALASSTAASGTVDNLSPMDASVGTTAASLPVSNRLGWTGLDNAKCYVARNMDLGTWDLIQLECS